jgi:hypothetical protein
MAHFRLVDLASWGQFQPVQSRRLMESSEGARHSCQYSTGIAILLSENALTASCCDVASCIAAGQARHVVLCMDINVPAITRLGNTNVYQRIVLVASVNRDVLHKLWLSAVDLEEIKSRESWI